MRGLKVRIPHGLVQVGNAHHLNDAVRIIRIEVENALKILCSKVFLGYGQCRGH